MVPDVWFQCFCRSGCATRLQTFESWWVLKWYLVCWLADMQVELGKHLRNNFAVAAPGTRAEIMIVPKPHASIGGYESLPWVANRILKVFRGCEVTHCHSCCLLVGISHKEIRGMIGVGTGVTAVATTSDRNFSASFPAWHAAAWKHVAALECRSTSEEQQGSTRVNEAHNKHHHEICWRIKDRNSRFWGKDLEPIGTHWNPWMALILVALAVGDALISSAASHHHG